tara:strand:+ start:256 stop:1344 length:1089 start_codon:yes stop_codon:yes gene_type:complete
MRQHYVPKTYLKNFAKRSKREFVVDVYDKLENRHFKSSTRGILAENDLYTLDDDNTFYDGDKLIIEKIYSDGIEPLYPKAYKLLTDDQISRVTDIQRSEIFVGIFQLYMRNPRFVTESISYHDNEVSKIYVESLSNGVETIRYGDEVFNLKKMDLEQIKEICKNRIIREFQETHLAGTGRILKFHENAKMEVYKIVDNAEFLTSDNPLISLNSVYNNENALSKSMEFTVPLNKKYALRILHDNRKENNVIYRQPILAGNANSINDDIYQKSRRFVIGSEKTLRDYFRMKKLMESTDLDLKMNAIRQILNKIPISEENRELMEISKYYLDKYDKEGGLSDKDSLDFDKKIHRIALEAKKKRTK